MAASTRPQKGHFQRSWAWLGDSAYPSVCGSYGWGIYMLLKLLKKMNWWHFPKFLGMVRLHQMIQWFLSILASVQTSRIGYNDGDCCWTSMGWKSHFGVDKCPEVRTLCHPHSVVMVFAMDILRTIVLASIGSKVFWFQLKSFPFWSVAMCPHALSRIFWPSYHKNRYLSMTC